MSEAKRNRTRLIIVGATGMIGGEALGYALDHPSVAHVTVVGRRMLGRSHPKLKEILHQDFSNCSSLVDKLVDHDAALFCLGTYTGIVSDEELRRITVDYAIEFARALRAASPNATFSLLSASGADPSEKSLFAFARYKGAAENGLRQLGFPILYIFRPAYIYPVKPRNEPTFGYRLLRIAYPVLRVLFPNHVIRSDVLAKAMVDFPVQKLGSQKVVVLENHDIAAFANARTEMTETN